MSRVPLLLDTDIGDDVDDVFALLLAARCPDVELLGVTTVYGDVAERARIARKLLRLAERDEVPVVAGSALTLSGRDPGAMITSGKGFAPDEPEADLSRNGDAATFLLDTIASADAPPVLVAVGPLTNVGLALRREPAIARRLRSLIVMGGRLGADAEQGEHNVNCDPEATRLVLESGANLALGTLEITRQATVDRVDVARLRDLGDPACAAAADMLERYLNEYRKRDWTSMYDPLTLTLAYTDSYLRTRPMRIRGTYSERLSRVDAVDGEPNARVSVGLDAAGFRDHLLATIATRYGA